MMKSLLAAVTQTQGTAMLPRDGLETAADISLVILAVGTALALLAMTVLLLQIRKLMSGMQSQLQPVADRARAAAENVEYISAVVRTDIQKVNDSVTKITSRLNDASDHMEERIAEFNALMQVVQGEAEDIFLDTAAAARGVRAGARTLSGGASDGSEDQAPSAEQDEATLHKVGAPEKPEELHASPEESEQV
ncbi:MAG: hypothetical protein BMS9Abin29_0959 [Gemmatimonadota bacterium]|nr:MAG: hypothetical protein BMS9Abin29_0959 [Gemmatimonadota bacterium]